MSAKPIAQIWTELIVAGKQDAAGIFAGNSSVPVARLGNVNTKDRPMPGIYVALDREGAKKLKPITHRGFVLEVTEGTFFGSRSPEVFALLRSNDVAFNEVFLTFVERLVAKLQEGLSKANAVDQMVKEWLAFFRRVGDDPLEIEELTGLWGELSFLQELLKSGFSYSKVLEAWQGPKGAAWDFSLAALGKNVLVEVKTTIRPKTVITVNGMDQLCVVQNFDCYLNFRTVQHVLIDDSGSDSHPDGTIVELIEALRDLLRKNADGGALVADFNDRLELAGYHPVHERHYLKNVFNPVASRWHVIDQTFPALTRHRLPADLRDRVEKVTYRLNIAGLPEQDSPFEPE